MTVKGPDSPAAKRNALLCFGFIVLGIVLYAVAGDHSAPPSAPKVGQTWYVKDGSGALACRKASELERLISLAVEDDREAFFVQLARDTDCDSLDKGTAVVIDDCGSLSSTFHGLACVREQGDPNDYYVPIRGIEPHVDGKSAE